MPGCYIVLGGIYWQSKLRLEAKHLSLLLLVTLSQRCVDSESEAELHSDSGDGDALGAEESKREAAQLTHASWLRAPSLDSEQ